MRTITILTISMILILSLITPGYSSAQTAINPTSSVENEVNDFLNVFFKASMSNDFEIMLVMMADDSIVRIPATRMTSPQTFTNKLDYIEDLKKRLSGIKNEFVTREIKRKGNVKIVVSGDEAQMDDVLEMYIVSVNSRGPQRGIMDRRINLRKFPDGWKITKMYISDMIWGIK